MIIHYYEFIYIASSQLFKPHHDYLTFQLFQLYFVFLINLCESSATLLRWNKISIEDTIYILNLNFIFYLFERCFIVKSIAFIDHMLTSNVLQRV